MLVHAEKVTCKDGSLITACTTADFNNGILGIIRVGRNEKEFDVLLHLGNLRLEFRDFFLSHFPQVLILLAGEYFLCGCYIVKGLLVLLTRLDDGFEFLVVLVELDKFFHIGHCLRA